MVYPRVCGGTEFVTRWATHEPGLSPRVRGNLTDEIPAIETARSIPACAGEPHLHPLPAVARRVYPRVCGGTSLEESRAFVAKGLSPRVRGNPDQMDQAYVDDRSIPACAGEPRCRIPGQAPQQVYPRVCGGTSSSGSTRSLINGLSPRVRGNLVSGLSPRVRGNQIRSFHLFDLLTVYPRVCGGTGVVSMSITHSIGLSPRVRGNHCISRHIYLPKRSIPACAGEPSPSVSSAVYVRVYPRVCGGTISVNGAGRSTIGLSPRVRGNLLKVAVQLANAGSIPACAGEPDVHQSAVSERKVYPRVCGGTLVKGQCQRVSEGLSPRVRGNPKGQTPRPNDNGSIPACAGEPGC